MNKDFQKLEMIYEAADRLAAAGIKPSFNMIFGYPGEGDKERRESIQLIMNICRQYPGAEFWTNIFTPYPGSPVMERAFELGIQVPQDTGRMVGFLPALHGAAVAQREGARAAADYARLYARGVSSRAGRAVTNGAG